MSTLPPPPDLDDRHVRRPRLYQWLDPPGARLTLVAGFPGCGKTALVREWLDTGDAASAAWVALGNPGLQSPRRFWAAVFDGLHGVDDRYGTPERAALRRTGLVTESLLAGLVDQLDNADRPVVLVLDGFEAVTDDATQRSLAWFLDHRPLTL